VSRSDELADRALELAQAFVERTDGQLAELSGGDTEALTQAAEVVRSTRSDQPEAARSAEHIAFTLLHRAFSQAVARQREGGASPAGG
jgi:hypothetical protein